MSVESERSFGAVIRDIGGNVTRIIRAELRFVVAELRVGLHATSADFILVLAGALCATLAVGFLLLGAMFALALVMPTWVAALLVASLVGVVALFLLAAGRARLMLRLNSSVTAVAPSTEPPE